MENSYFIAFCIVLLLAFIFVMYINGDYLKVLNLNTDDKILEENGSLDVTTNIEDNKI